LKDEEIKLVWRGGRIMTRRELLREKGGVS
jgi:hypothetical protein